MTDNDSMFTLISLSISMCKARTDFDITTDQLQAKVIFRKFTVCIATPQIVYKPWFAMLQ